MRTSVTRDSDPQKNPWQRNLDSGIRGMIMATGQVKEDIPNVCFSDFMRFMFAVIFPLVALSGCGTSPATRGDVERLAREAVQTSVPAQATEVFGSDAVGFARSISIRFRCREEEAAAFLAQASHVERKLTPGERAVVDTMCSERWWHPDELRNVRGSTFAWNNNRQAGHCAVMVGSDGGPGVVVYLTTTVENRQ